METSTLNLIDILKNTQAFYSTDFSSDYEPPADLLEILLETSNSTSINYDGIIFLQKISNDSYIVVDGMKRLISLSLLLHAICECYKLTNEKNIKAIEKIKKQYLFGKLGTKLQLSGNDKTIYEKLIKYERMTDEEKFSPMFIVLHEFWAKIKMQNISASKLFNQIKKIKVMAFISDRFDIDNRDLYQFLNCRTPNLSQIRLITDYVDEIYDKDADSWHGIMNLFENFTEFLPLFLRDFLTIQKDGFIPQKNELYFSFKHYFEKFTVYQKPEEIFKTIEKFAKYYIKLIQADFDNFEIKKQIITINENKMQETYPYLLEVLDDIENNRINTEMFIEILSAIIKFITEKNENNLSSVFTFANLSQELNKRI